MAGRKIAIYGSTQVRTARSAAKLATDDNERIRRMENFQLKGYFPGVSQIVRERLPLFRCGKELKERVDNL